MRENSLNAWDRRVIKSVLCFWGFMYKVEKISVKIKYCQGLSPNTTNSEGNSGKITPQQQDMCKMSRAWYQKSYMWPGKPQEVKQSTLLDGVKCQPWQKVREWLSLKDTRNLLTLFPTNTWTLQSLGTLPSLVSFSIFHTGNSQQAGWNAA